LKPVLILTFSVLSVILTTTSQGGTLMRYCHEATKCDQRMMDKTVLNLTAGVAAGRILLWGLYWRR
jgi:hypothetical protein